MCASSGAARWREITDFLRTDILQGHYQPGQALPGEAFMADEYATSRPTIRKAIAQLVSEGLLTVAHGRGTFVRARPDRRLIAFGSSPAEDLLSPAYDPAAQGWEHVTVPSDIEMFLWMPPSGDRADDVIMADSTIFSTLFGADESLRTFWGNLASAK